MTSSLVERTAIVTGVSRRNGIGFAIARLLSDSGARVFTQSWVRDDPYSDADELTATLAELEATDEGAHVEADFADPRQPARVVEAARKVLGHVDILVANHARSVDASLAELTADELDAHLHVNVRATMLLVKEFADRHDGRGGGRVVLFTSGQHLAPMRTEVPYAISKGAIHHATATLADELIERGITVNTVNPGPTDTAWADAGSGPPPGMPLGRWGHPDDAARLVAWLCSDDAGWITGQVIDSEGGFRRWVRL